MPETVVLLDRENGLVKLNELLEDPRDLMNLIGEQLAADSSSAFDTQGLPGDRWDERYPSQEDPFVNVAGVLEALNRGKNPPQRVFRRRPALRSTGALKDSVSHDLRGTHEVSVGSRLEYAAVHQWGGTSSQPVTEQAKDALKKLLEKDKWVPYWGKLYPLLGMDELVTQIVQRPFLGISDERARWIKARIERWVKEEMEGSTVGIS